MVLTDSYDVAIIGGGASGMSTALYCKRAGLNPLIIERGLMGGQINNTSTIENYLGVGNISGEELSENMYQQIIENDIDVLYTNIKNITFDEVGKTAILQSRKYTIEAKTVVLATGVKHKELGAEGEKECQGAGVSYCATCDGYFFKDKHVAVIGGGDSALEEGAFLADFAKEVTLIYRKGKEDLRAKESLKDRFFSKANTSIIEWASVFEFQHDGGSLKSASYEEEVFSAGQHYVSMKSIDVDGAFVYVGVEPINDLAIKAGVETDSNGYIIVNNKLQTNVENMFAVGDIIHPDMKQVAIAVSDGAVVSKYIKEYLEMMI